MTDTLPIPAQRKDKGAAALLAADDRHVVIDPWPFRHPILRVRPYEP
jgi:hypothetical protein